MDMVLKRKIYKRAPFHKVEKESNGDGVITESLININQSLMAITCSMAKNQTNTSELSQILTYSHIQAQSQNNI